MGTQDREITYAKNLSDIDQALSPEPLLTKRELDNFYCNINPQRGSDVVERMEILLRKASQRAYFKAFLIGHSGVGKSTEINRLIQTIQDKYQPLKISAMPE